MIDGQRKNKNTKKTTEVGDNMTNEKLVENIINLSKKKKELMTEILDVTKRQREFIKLEKIETVAKQIELKEKIMGDVDKIDLMFYKLINELKSDMKIDSLDKIDTHKYPQVKDLKEAVGEILSIANETKLVDDENILMIQSGKGDLSNKLKGLRQGQKVSNAYGAQKKMVKNMFVDRKK